MSFPIVGHADNLFFVAYNGLVISKGELLAISESLVGGGTGAVTVVQTLPDSSKTLFPGIIIITSLYSTWEQTYIQATHEHILKHLM